MSDPPVLERAFPGPDPTESAAASGNILGLPFEVELLGSDDDVAGATNLLQVRRAGPGRGKGLFARQPVALAGEDGKRVDRELFREDPLIVVQSNPDEVLACWRCCRLIGPFEASAIHSGLLTAPAALPHVDECFRDDLPDAVHCDHPPLGDDRCPAAYCSEWCRERDWDERHAWLCASVSTVLQNELVTVSEEVRIAAFLAAQFGRTADRRLREAEREAGHPVDGEAASAVMAAAWAPYKHFQSISYFDVIKCRVSSDETRDEADEVFVGFYQDLMVGFPEGPWRSFLSYERVDRLAGIGILNPVGMPTSPSPLGSYLSNLKVLYPDEHEALLASDDFADRSRWADGDGGGEEGAGGKDTPPRFHGGGLYPLQATMNHACNPNAYQFVVQDTWEIAVVPCDDLEAGEEICITYITLVEDVDEGNLRCVGRGIGGVAGGGKGRGSGAAAESANEKLYFRKWDIFGGLDAGHL